MEDVLEAFREARELRRRYADWDFIQRLPPRLRATLIYYIETGTSGGRSGSAGLIWTTSET